MKIEPAQRLQGHINGLGGDKSISHRAAIIAALASGQTRITNFSTSQDCQSTLDCLARLGVSIERDQNTVRVAGAGAGAQHRPPLLRPSDQALDCGNSGSTMRMLAGVLAGQSFNSTLTGDESLRGRPMKRIIEPLEMMGARLTAEEGHAPLRIEGRYPLTPIHYRMPIASAQVKSAILLAGLHADGETGVIEDSARTRDHTERMLRWFGVEVTTKAGDDDDGGGGDGGGASLQVIVRGGARLLAGGDISVPGDISSAAFLIAAAAMLPNSSLRIDGVGLNPTRAAIIDTLAGLGADVRAVDVRDECNEVIGSIEIRGAEALVPPAGGGGSSSSGAAHILRGPVIANLIDELPVLAVFGSQVEGGLEIRDAAELRVKESDRIRATVANLRAMGADVEEYKDGLAVHGPSRLRGAALDAHGDHRIAMAFTIAALAAEGESELSGAECVGVSFPEFFELLGSVTKR